jgi:hypothetical protein
MFGKAVVADVWQIGKSGPANGADISTAVAPAPARVTMFPTSKVANAVLPSAAAPAETNSLCDLVKVAMSYSKIGRRKKSAESEIQPVTLSGIRRKPLITNFETFPALSARHCNARTLRHLSVVKSRL